MSCPDWRGLAAHRDDSRNVQDAEPRGWREALEHFDGGCPRCRREALAADPTLVFRRLPRVEMSAAQEAAEVDAVLQAVTAMRTASRIEALDRRSRAGSWKRWAAAAVLTGASLSIPSDNVGGGGRRPEGVEPAFPPAQVTQGMMLPAAFEAELPTLEEGNLPDARVYHVGSQDLEGVMIVDASLEL